MSLGRDKIDLPKAFSLIICDFGMTVCSMTRCKIKSAALLDGAQARTRLSGNSFNTLLKQTNKKRVTVRKDVIVLVVQPCFQGPLLKGPIGERPVNKVITCKARLCSKRNWGEPSATSLWNPRCPHMISEKDLDFFSSQLEGRVRQQGPQGTARVQPCCKDFASIPSKLLVVSWCCGHQWRNTKDWKDTEQYPHHNTKANQQ